MPDPLDPMVQIKGAFQADDAAEVERLLGLHPELKARINDPVGPFDSPAILHVRSPAMLDVLLAAGADLNAKSQWWAGGFGLLHSGPPEIAAYAIERGAVVDACAAARLGLLETLRALVAADPERVHERGGDGQPPLHFASTVEVADFLLDHGAAIDARDVDHESTPAQYMTRDRQPVLRRLIERGCATDLLMAAALGDLDLARRHLEADPGCIRMRVSDEFFPMISPQAGGTIYQWTLGFYASAPEVASDFGHGEFSQWLLDRSPAPQKLIAACWMGDEPLARALHAAHPEAVDSLPEGDRRLPAHAARNNNTRALCLLLEIGLPVDARGQHGGMPLHWAAFHGNAEMTRFILRFGPPLEAKDDEFQSTPMGWALHGSENGWHSRTGDYAATVAALIEAGARLPDAVSGSEAARAVLRNHGVPEA
jgi:hypothetical protein